jgi:hypothetical protein
MKRSFALAFLMGVSCLCIFAFSNPGLCQMPLGAPMDPSMGMMGPACPPPGCGPMPQFPMGPCMPTNDCNSFSLEGGARAYYPTLSTYLRNPNTGQTDLIRDLSFSPNYLLGEVYAALRVPPTFAFTYTFQIPRQDDGNGILPTNITVNGVQFLAGSHVAAQTLKSQHRFEGEYYFMNGCNYRVGPYVMGELFVHRLEMKDALVSTTHSNTWFVMGVGASGEFAPSKNVFGRLKAAYTFLNNQNGVYLDFEGKFFPEFMTSCGGGMKSTVKPYVGVGYRYRNALWQTNTSADLQIDTIVYGPHAEFGLIF